MNKIVVSCGWCSFAESRKDSPADPIQYTPSYLNAIWRQQIEKYVVPDEYFIYASKCDIYPDPLFTPNIVRGHVYAREQQHRYDWYNSITVAGQFAFCNEMDLVIIEQDCLVHGLDKALEWARGKDMVYGYGPNCSFRPGWSENSFMFVSNKFLPEMLHRLNVSGVHRKFDTPRNVSEVEWHKLFADAAAYWEFGCGRLRPIPWDEPIFYAQQLSLDEINSFMAAK